MLKNLWIIVRSDIILNLREAFSWAAPLLFFIIAVCLFPLALGGDKELLKSVAPGLIWVVALLAVLLSIGNLFKPEVREGFLDLLLLSSWPLTILVFCKIFAHWLTHCLPLIIVSPLLGLILHLSLNETFTLIITLLLGTPALCLLGAIGAALLVGVRGSGLLLPILIMPLYIPVLIFGTGTIIAANAHNDLSGYFAILGAFSLFSLALSPPFASLALRLGVNP